MDTNTSKRRKSSWNYVNEPLQRSDLCLEVTGYSLQEALDVMKSPPAKFAGRSVLVFRNVIQPETIDFEEVLRRSTISKEKLREVSKGVFVEESEDLAEEEKEGVIQKMVHCSKDLQIENHGRFVSKFFEHAQSNDPDYYVRDQEVPLNRFYLDKIEHSLIYDREIPGVSKPYGYYGTLFSNTSWHREDGNLSSWNLLRGGAPKLWAVADHTMRPKFVEKFYETMKENSKRKKICPLILEHKIYIVCLSKLDEWGIPYAIVEQREGDLVFVIGCAYHLVMNAGFNYAEAINYADAAWNDRIGVDLPSCNCDESGLAKVNIERDRSKFCIQKQVHSSWHICSEADCEKRFVNATNLKKHMEEDHNKIENFPCYVCDKTFKTKGNLTRHIENIHQNNVKRIICSICNKSVKNHSQHLKVHSPFNKKECRICKKKICERKFKSHEDSCMIVCPQCNLECKSKRGLTQHMKSAHKVTK